MRPTGVKERPRRDATLRVDGLTKSFGGVDAVDGVSFGVQTGEVLGVIGPNGSGKSTLLNLINGLIPADAGTIMLGAESLTGLRAVEVASRGGARTFQAPRAFGSLTALRNVIVGRTHSGDARPSTAEAQGHLKTVGLADHSGMLAAELSGGQRKLLDLARVLARKPTFALLDEPTSGVHPAAIQVVKAAVRELSRTGPVVLVSHSLEFVRAVASRILVVHNGAVIAQGRWEEIVNQETVVDAYLGAQWN